MISAAVLTKHILIVSLISSPAGEEWTELKSLIRPAADVNPEHELEIYLSIICPGGEECPIIAGESFVKACRWCSFAAGGCSCSRGICLCILSS